MPRWLMRWFGRARETTLTIRRVLEVQAALQLIESVAADPATAPPIKTSYWLARNGESIEAEVRAYRAALRKLYVDGSAKDAEGRAKYTELDGGRVKFELLDPIGTQARREALLDQEVVLRDLKLLGLEDFAPCPVPPTAIRLLLGVIIERREPRPTAA